MIAWLSCGSGRGISRLLQSLNGRGGGNHSKLTTNEDGGEEGSLEHYRAVLGVG